jgi:hypothetical protein
MEIALLKNAPASKASLGLAGVFINTAYTLHMIYLSHWSILLLLPLQLLHSSKHESPCKVLQCKFTGKVIGLVAFYQKI